MAALVAGVQYGLSSQTHFYENKSLIFVKLTDSAHRAIEDFLKNRNKTNNRPTIQFLENEGRLSFPSPQANHGSVNFTFSLSDGHDVEGPQGAFECIQQTNPNNLESLGTLPYKMRIHANEDVYEKTRHRMAVCAENNQNKCTRVLLKANGPDIGRKVKVKSAGKSAPAPSNARHTNNHRDTSIPNSTSRPTIKNSIANSQSSSALSSQPSAASSSFLSSNSSSNNSMMPSLSSSSATAAALTARFLKSTSTPSARSQPDKKASDLLKRPLRERLIHILALRPYKKPELYERLNKEGLKDREKKEMVNLLRILSTVRNNSYHLHRHVWNDVQEDWPFYSEQDRAMLKRRKPQNLTPPGSSDGGSSGSGQSPNSTHPGSPPAITAPPPNFMNCKRPGYYQGNDGIQTKKPRISHYRKPEPPSRTPSSANSNSSSGNIVNNNTSVSVHSGNNLSSSHNSNINNNNNDVNNWNEQRQQSSDRDINYHRSERTSNSDVLRGNNNNNNNSYQLNVNNNNNIKSSFTPNRDRDELISNSNSNRTASSSATASSLSSSSAMMLSSVSTFNAAKYDSRGHCNSSPSTGANSGSSEFSARERERERERRERDREELRRERERERERLERLERVERQERERTREINSDNNWNSNASKNSVGTVPEYRTAGTGAVGYETNGNNNHDIPDYLMQYKPVTNIEQRRKYKDDYSRDQPEYTELCAHKLNIKKHFEKLKELRAIESARGNREKEEEINSQIIADYDKIKHDRVEIEKDRRYNYLLGKLKYIRGLINDFDRGFSMEENENSGAIGSNNNSSKTGVSTTDLRY